MSGHQHEVSAAQRRCSSETATGLLLQRCLSRSGAQELRSSGAPGLRGADRAGNRRSGVLAFGLVAAAVALARGRTGQVRAPMSAPTTVAPGHGATALWKDGPLSFKDHHLGTCASHGGVEAFYKVRLPGSCRSAAMAFFDGFRLESSHENFPSDRPVRSVDLLCR